jgi:hypothetical protein
MVRLDWTFICSLYFMSAIFYYSKYCEMCRSFLMEISKSPLVKKATHFVCIDKRFKESSGRTWIVLENGEKTILPAVIVKVPSLLLLREKCQVLVGDQILRYLTPICKTELAIATNNNIEPVSFSFSDSLSFVGTSLVESPKMKSGGSFLDAYYNQPSIDCGVQDNNASNGATSRDTDENMRAKLEEFQSQRENELATQMKNRPPVI